MADLWDLTWYAGALALAGAVFWLGFRAGQWWEQERLAEAWDEAWRERRRLVQERRELCD